MPLTWLVVNIHWCFIAILRILAPKSDGINLGFFMYICGCKQIPTLWLSSDIKVGLHEGPYDFLTQNALKMDLIVGREIDFSNYKEYLVGYVSVRQVVSCMPMNSTTVQKVNLFRNLRIRAYFQLHEAFRRLLDYLRHAKKCCHISPTSCSHILNLNPHVNPYFQNNTLDR